MPKAVQKTRRSARARRPSIRLALIGGSGLYQMAALAKAKPVKVRTPFGDPSDAIVVGEIGGVEVGFLPRHGVGHRIPPSEINFRANLWALKLLGAEFLVSVGAVGSLREEIRPGDLVVPDQFIDRTRGRKSTFFETGIVAHVAFADPTCAALTGLVLGAARSETASGAVSAVHAGGAYLCMEGPQFSTRAESHLYRQWGAAVIGMTNLQEAKLAREAEICFATLAIASDYDCWNPHAGDVEISEILRILGEGTAAAQRIVAAVAAALPASRSCPCATALGQAIITDRAKIPVGLRRKLAPIVGKHLS